MRRDVANKGKFRFQLSQLIRRKVAVTVKFSRCALQLNLSAFF
jgi:hypothetical protein